MYCRIYGWKSRFRAPLMHHHKTKFPTIYTTIQQYTSPIEEFPIIGFYLYHVTSAGQSSNWTTSGIKQHIYWLLILLYRTAIYHLKFFLKKLKKTAIINWYEESEKTACHYGLRYFRVFCTDPNCIRFFNECPGPFEINKILHTCL